MNSKKVKAKDVKAARTIIRAPLQNMLSTVLLLRRILRLWLQHLQSHSLLNVGLRQEHPVVTLLVHQLYLLHHHPHLHHLHLQGQDRHFHQPEDRTPAI